MTHNPEMRFRCDRCTVDLIVPMESHPKTPLDWMALWQDSQTAPALHLCPLCAPKFLKFMDGDEPA